MQNRTTNCQNFGGSIMRQMTRRCFIGTAGAAGAAISIWRPRSMWGDENPRRNAPATLALGLQSYTLREFPVERAIELAKELGFAHVEFTRVHASADTPAAK